MRAADEVPDRRSAIDPPLRRGVERTDLLATAAAVVLGGGESALARSAALYEALVDDYPVQAPYAVSLAYRMRYAMQMNAREAMHVLELRSSPQGHPAYRRIAQEMHRLIAEQAGHRAIAAAMRHVDHRTYELERLAAERAAEAKRAAARG